MLKDSYVYWTLDFVLYCRQILCEKKFIEHYKNTTLCDCQVFAKICHIYSDILLGAFLCQKWSNMSVFDLDKWVRHAMA